MCRRHQEKNPAPIIRNRVGFCGRIGTRFWERQCRDKETVLYLDPYVVSPESQTSQAQTEYAELEGSGNRD